jgi:hypothetical protein
MSAKQKGLSLLVFAAMVGGGLLAKYTDFFWLGFALFLAVFLAVIIFGCGPWIDRVTRSMARAINRGEHAEAIRIGERELEKGTATTGVKLNLVAAYCGSDDINKAKAVLKSIEEEKLTSAERRVFEDWNRRIKEAQH